MARTIPNSTNYRGEFVGDLQVWLRQQADDNDEQLSRLKRNLRKAREQELTPRQRQILAMHFDQDQSVSQIARELEVNPSTVTRTLQRAKRRLYRCLRYGL
jgi:RNA polymerase sigma factor (sigma-70 family)